MTITDQEFLESAANREAVYRDELKRAAVTSGDDITYMDRLGRGRWPIDYYTARLAGYPHADAMRVERIAIRKAGNLPNTEAQPPAPSVPTQPPVSGLPPQGPGVVDDMIRFAHFYRTRCAQTGFAPDALTTRGDRISFLQATVMEYQSLFPLEAPFVMKRASATRPISDEVVVFTAPGDDYRRFWDFLADGGAPNWHVKTTARELGHGEILPNDQLLVDPNTLEVIRG